MQGNKEAEAHFQEVGKAYDTLRDKEKRAIYDQVRSLLPAYNYFQYLRIQKIARVHLSQGMPIDSCATPLASFKHNLVLPENNLSSSDSQMPLICITSACRLVQRAWKAGQVVIRAAALEDSEAALVEATSM